MNVKFYVKRSKFELIMKSQKFDKTYLSEDRKSSKKCTSLTEKNRPPVRTYSKTKYGDF